MMNILATIECVDTHLDTAPFRFIIGGIPALHGSTMTERMLYMKEHYDWIRKFVTHEAGGKRALCGGVLLEPICDEADFGVFYFDSANYQPMCGGGTLSLAHTVVSLGLVPVTEPVTHITFETPCGLIRTHVAVKNNEIQSVTLDNIPSFVMRKGIELDVPEIGKINLDVCYGGNTFAVVDVEQIGMDINPATVPELGRKGMQIMAELNKAEPDIHHPDNPDINYRDNSQLLWVQAPDKKGAPAKAQCVYGDCKTDDCPCGTGTSARMAREFAYGRLDVGEEFIQQNNKNKTTKEFYGKILGTTEVAGIPAINPSLTSYNASVISLNKFVLTSTMKYKEGCEGM